MVSFLVKLGACSELRPGAAFWRKQVAEFGEGLFERRFGWVVDKTAALPLLFLHHGRQAGPQIIRLISLSMSNAPLPKRRGQV